jgi:hypothetical protein
LNPDVRLSRSSGSSEEPSLSWILPSRRPHRSDLAGDAPGHVSDEELAKVRQAGYNADIAEIVGHVALNVFTNYFNTVAQTDMDFPRTAKRVPVRS